MTARRAHPAPPAAASNDVYGVAYFRVSTSRQANTSYDEDGFSIQAQREYCQRKAADMGVQLVDEYIDRGKSARTADRPGLQAMLARIKEDTDIQYVFVHKLDRLARNRADDVQIGLLLAKHGVRLVSCTENIDDTPSGKLVRGIMGDIAEWYSSNLSEESKKGLRKKVEAGGTPGHAPLGYVNTRLKIVALGKDIGTVKVHRRYGPLVTECFNLYATGRCTLRDVVTYANDRGLRLKPDKRLPERSLTVQQMQRLLRNRYYTGWIRFGGVEYKGEHEALIDEPTFNRVQALLTARNRNRDKSHKRPHHLKGVLYCARCGRRLGITVAKQRRCRPGYPYFFCLGRQVDKNSCPQGYIPIGDIEAAVQAYWAQIQLPADRVRALRQVILDSFTGKHDQGQTETAKQRQRIIQLEQRRHKAKAAYYADALTLEEFKHEQEAVRQGIASAQALIAEWTIELDSLTRALDDALRLVTNPQVLYAAMPESLKAVLMQTVFEKLWVFDQDVAGADLTQPYEELLTVDARLHLATQAASLPASRAGMGSSATYHRRRETEMVLLDTLGDSWNRPPVVRPRGPLPIDTKNPGPYGAQGSKINHLVGVMGFNLNPTLKRWLGKQTVDNIATGTAITGYRARKWRVVDRLTERDMVRLIMAFKLGMPKYILAERYGLGVRSVKKVLRQHGVRKRSRYG